MKKITPILKIAEILVLAIIGGIMAFSKMDIQDGALRMALLLASIALGLLYLLSLFRLSQSGVERGESTMIIARRKFALMALSMAAIGIMYTFRHYPGGKMMLTMGIIGMGAVLVMLAFSGEENVKAREYLTFNKQELAPRLIAGIAISSIIWIYGNRIEPYHAKTELVESLTSSEMISVPISSSDARLIAAWYDISRGFSKEKVLKAYGVSEAEYNEKAEALAYGGEENIPPERNIKIIGEYQRDLNWPYTDFNKLVAPEDTAYVYSLRSVVYQLLSNDPYLQRAMDLDNIAKHTDDQAFKAFVEEDLKEERFYLDKLPVIY